MCQYTSDIFFCSCFKKTFNNYFYIWEKNHATYDKKMYNYILSSKFFPYDFVKKMLQKNIPSSKDAVLKNIKFKDNICHQCNAISPLYHVNFCNMSTFELGHAWYLKKFEMDLGLEISTEFVPPEYLEVLEIVQKILPTYKLVKNYRPDWLDRLELDIFISDIPLGIEYQGIQHYHPIKHWGGEDGLKKRKEHDMRKYILAQKNNIPIIYFTYKDIITPEFVYERIQPYLNPQRK